MHLRGGGGGNHPQNIRPSLPVFLEFTRIPVGFLFYPAKKSWEKCVIYRLSIPIAMIQEGKKWDTLAMQYFYDTELSVCVLFFLKKNRLTFRFQESFCQADKVVKGCKGLRAKASFTEAILRVFWGFF